MTHLHRIVISALLALTAVGLLGAVLLNFSKPMAQETSKQPLVGQPAPTPTPPAPAGPIELSQNVRLATPLSGQLITSPVEIRGEARGVYYFEASFPVKLLDAAGEVVAVAPAQAQGEWMTTEFVPFSVTLSFVKPTSTTGWLVLQKDNPSGLPEYDEDVRIPIRYQ